MDCFLYSYGPDFICLQINKGTKVTKTISMFNPVGMVYFLDWKAKHNPDLTSLSSRLKTTNLNQNKKEKWNKFIGNKIRQQHAGRVLHMNIVYRLSRNEFPVTHSTETESCGGSLD